MYSSSPRSRLRASWVAKVDSLAHLAQISSSVLGKSSAGGRLAIIVVVSVVDFNAGDLKK